MENWNSNSEQVFLDRYALKDTEGKPIEHNPRSMWQRVGDAVGRTPTEREDFYKILEDFRFVPGGRILSSAGSGHEVTAYNCYVIPVEPDQEGMGNDSRSAIFDTIKRMVGIMSRGGGVGINWSTLRPTGSHLRRINGTSSGPIGWMDVASRAVGEVIQGGSRRGAAMFMLSDWHPDIQAFIEAKRNLRRITNANISVAISDAFMRAVKEDAEWGLLFPDTDHPDYNTDWDGDLWYWITRHGWDSIILHDLIPARTLWRQIADAAWDNGEPGVVFLERCQKESTASSLERIISVNPCGEQPLGPYSVCNLGAMNLSAYTTDRFDMTSFIRDARTAVRFLDSVIDITYYIEEVPQTYTQQKMIRRVGLGVMGLADALIKLGLRYGSPEAVEFTGKVFYAMKLAALKESVALARQLGPAPGWDHVIESVDGQVWELPYLADLPDDLTEDIQSYGLRNLLLLTQAPTGTTSMLAGVNSGIEPYFAFSFTRNDRLGTRRVSAPEYLLAASSGVLVTSNDVTVDEHIAMQAAAQRFVDSSISKTINAPNNHTVEDVEQAYMLAYDRGLKGIAYFRDGCGREQVLIRDSDSPELVPDNEHVHDTYRKDGCVYCRGCDWSACTI